MTKLTKVTMVKKEIFTFYVESNEEEEHIKNKFNEMENAEVENIWCEAEGNVYFYVDECKTTPEGTGLKYGAFYVTLGDSGKITIHPENDDQK